MVVMQRPPANALRRPAGPPPRSALPVFVYGLGAPKAGTTWLYEYLRGHPECHLRGIKELNYFTSITGIGWENELRRLYKQIDDVAEDLSRSAPDDSAKAAASLLDMRDYQRVLKTCVADKNAYFRYLMQGLRHQKLVADISPDYGLLGEDMLGRMVATAPKTRFIYLMRDPVDRFWSHLRMSVRVGLKPGEEFATKLHEALHRAMSGEETDEILDHSDYAKILTKIETAIPEHRRLVMFYEDLMTPAGLRSLCRFVGIKPIMGNFDRVANEGRAGELTLEERASLRRFLRPQYEAVASRFRVLPEAWRKTMAEGFE